MQINTVEKQNIWDETVRINVDPYSKATVDYARRWAELMEKKIADGQTVEDCAKQTSHDADTEGIRGFMFRRTVNILASVWAHGEELRLWHNHQYGVHSIKGTVNPAVITISGE